MHSSAILEEHFVVAVVCCGCVELSGPPYVTSV